MGGRGPGRRALQRPVVSLLGWAALRVDGAADGNCTPHFEPPEAFPAVNATLHNGVALEDVCFTGPGPFHVFIIGDWGGNGSPPKPVFNRVRKWIVSVDDQAQQLVAARMAERAEESNLGYVINVGDNFYWAGVEASCDEGQVWTSQWADIFEGVYSGAGLSGKQWLGVLGNHDYGGYRFDSGWTQAISYSWVPQGRWMTPAQYWSVKVHYPHFSVDYYFVDSNVFNTWDPKYDAEHNICSLAHNKRRGSCARQGGPESVRECPGYFARLWRAQVRWLEARLGASEAEWQVVVTHFPPTWGRDLWKYLVEKFGIDLIVSGHEHVQYVKGPEDEHNFLAPTAWIVSGGGGGIQSEGGVDPRHGDDDAYGFMELALSKDVLEIVAISHGGHIRSTTRLPPRSPGTPYTFANTTTLTSTLTATLTSTLTSTSTPTSSSSPTWTSSPSLASVPPAVSDATSTSMPNSTSTLNSTSPRRHRGGHVTAPSLAKDVFLGLLCALAFLVVFFRGFCRGGAPPLDESGYSAGPSAGPSGEAECSTAPASIPQSSSDADRSGPLL